MRLRGNRRHRFGGSIPGSTPFHGQAHGQTIMPLQGTFGGAGLTRFQGSAGERITLIELCEEQVVRLDPDLYDGL